MEAGVGAASTSLGKWNLEAEISLDKWLSFRYWDVLNDKLLNPCRGLLMDWGGKRSGFLAGHSGYCSSGFLFIKWMLVLDLYWSRVDIQYKQSFGGVPPPDPCKSHPGLPVPLPAWSSLLFKHIRVLHPAFFSPHGIEIHLSISWCAGLCLVIVFHCMASPFVCWWMLLGWFLVLGYYEKAAMCIHFCGQIFLFILNRCRSNGSWDNAFLIYKIKYEVF